jgi:hypothetical protein
MHLFLMGIWCWNRSSGKSTVKGLNMLRTRCPRVLGVWVATNCVYCHEKYTLYAILGLRTPRWCRKWRLLLHRCDFWKADTELKTLKSTCHDQLTLSIIPGHNSLLQVMPFSSLLSLNCFGLRPYVWTNHHKHEMLGVNLGRFSYNWLTGIARSSGVKYYIWSVCLTYWYYEEQGS